MATVIKPELSEKNKYWINRNRYYELKYFCLQYPYWKKAYHEIDILKGRGFGLTPYNSSGSYSDPTGRAVEKRMLYFDRMKLIEQTAIATDQELASYILKAVTEGLSYNMLKSRLDIPCGRSTYYDRYRKFFWLLNKGRD